MSTQTFPVGTRVVLTNFPGEVDPPVDPPFGHVVPSWCIGIPDGTPARRGMVVVQWDDDPDRRSSWERVEDLTDY